MTEEGATKGGDLALAAITNARALLVALLAGGWRELHVAADGFEIFIAQPGGGTNPMRAVAGPPPPPSPAPPPPEQMARQDAHELVLRAPHVATLTFAAAEGESVGRGGIVARLALLDEVIPLRAEVDSVICRHHAAVGALLEYDAPILSLREVA